MSFQEFVSRFHREEGGQDVLEYALVTAAILAAVVAGSSSLGSTIGSGLATVNAKVTTLTAP